MLFMLIEALVWLFHPSAAHADYAVINATVDNVGGALPFLLPAGACVGNNACGFVEIAQAVVDRFRPLLSGAAVLVIVIAGYRMIIAQEDEAVTKARVMMTGTVSGLIMVWLIDPFIHAFYGSSGEVPRGAMAEGAGVLTVEVLGIIEWALTVVAALAVLMIIVTGLKAVAQPTSEEGIGNIRKTMISVAAGLILLVFRMFIGEAFTESASPIPLLGTAVYLISYLLGFLALIAIVMVIYAGFQYVLSFGKEETATQAKGLFIRVMVGAVVIIVSLALVNFILVPELA